MHWYVDRNELTMRPILVTDWDWGGGGKFSWYVNASRYGVHLCGPACVSKGDVFEDASLAAKAIEDLLQGGHYDAGTKSNDGREYSDRDPAGACHGDADLHGAQQSATRDRGTKRDADFEV